jgi:hypothetical protein
MIYLSIVHLCHFSERILGYTVGSSCLIGEWLSRNSFAGVELTNSYKPQLKINKIRKYPFQYSNLRNRCQSRTLMILFFGPTF